MWFSTGLLLHEIEGFWRVALLMSTLLNPVADRSSGSNGRFDLDRRDIFLRAESTITGLGWFVCFYLKDNSVIIL